MLKRIFSLIVTALLAIQSTPVFSFYHQSPYKTNEYGQSYGTLIEAENSLTEPDLIYALATNGKYGYIEKEELYACGPKSPDDVNWEARVFGNKSSYFVPVFENDGKTVIGEYQINKAESNTKAYDPRQGYTQGAQGHLGIINGIDYYYQNLKKKPTPFKTEARTLVEHKTSGSVPANTYGAQARIVDINDALVANSGWAMNPAFTAPSYVYADTSFIATSGSPLYYSKGKSKEWNGSGYWYHGGLPI